MVILNQFCTLKDHILRTTKHYFQIQFIEPYYVAMIQYKKDVNNNKYEI